MCPAKTAEPIEMLFGDVDSDWIMESCIRWGPDPPWEGAILMGRGGPL